MKFFSVRSTNSRLRLPSGLGVVCMMQRKTPGYRRKEFKSRIEGDRERRLETEKRPALGKRHVDLVRGDAIGPGGVIGRYGKEIAGTGGSGIGRASDVPFGDRLVLGPSG